MWYVEDELVDIETSKKLKKLGFNKPTYCYYLDKDLPYVKKGIYRVKFGKRRRNHNKYDDFIYSLPTKIEAEKWLKK